MKDQEDIKNGTYILSLYLGNYLLHCEEQRMWSLNSKVIFSECQDFQAFLSFITDLAYSAPKYRQTQMITFIPSLPLNDFRSSPQNLFGLEKNCKMLKK